MPAVPMTNAQRDQWQRRVAHELNNTANLWLSGNHDTSSVNPWALQFNGTMFYL